MCGRILMRMLTQSHASSQRRGHALREPVLAGPGRVRHGAGAVRSDPPVVACKSCGACASLGVPLPGGLSSK